MPQYSGVRGVYLICLERPLAPESGNSTARHYVGYADDIEIRFRRHRAGHGAKMLAAANRRGIEYSIVRVWPNEDKAFERLLKRRKNARKLCPNCGAPKDRAQ